MASRSRIFPVVAAEERRKYQRITLLQQLRGRIGDVRIFVVDASVHGVRVLHRDALVPIGAGCTVIFEWEGHTVELECVLRHTTLKRAAKSMHETSLYESGLEIVTALRDGAAVLRAMVEAHVLRALDEQRANARGVPAVAAQSFQTGKAEHFIRHEYIAGVWRETRTTEPRQPSNGFTISAEETADNVALLRTTYASGDSSIREMIRQTSSMSISTAEGIPTRRYEP